MSFKFKTFGARFLQGQVDRIDQGLVSIGGVPDDVNPDFIYCNDSGYYDKAIEYKKDVCPTAKLILNVLDIPSMNIGVNYDIVKTYDQLCKADAVTAISLFVQAQLLHFFNIYSVVIKNPIKNVNPDQRIAGIKKYPYKAMFAGRVADPYKRADLGLQSLLRAGLDPQEIVVVGSERLSHGVHMGIVSDEVLNDLYNSVDFVVDCSIFAGLSLPIIEGISSGAIPIFCHDLPTATEIAPRHWACFPSVTCISMYIRNLIDNPDLMKQRQDEVIKFSPLVIKAYNQEQIGKNVLAVYDLIK